MTPGDRAVDNHVVRLRRIIEADPRVPRTISSVYGVGYQLAGVEPKGLESDVVDR